jgi:nitroimidazol reductase NimA-like FMN-containing flavoprotein (pyridoxamine 5'-phosphate oxidase superfamily)
MAASLNMARQEREAFLAELHVGVISITDPDPQRAPLAAPIWYDFRLDTGVWVITSPTSRKGIALEKAGRYTIVAQTEELPYKYVSVEGPIVEVRPADRESDTRPMAHRYMGVELGNAYVDSQSDEGAQVYVMKPQRWLTLDYAKLRA